MLNQLIFKANDIRGLTGVDGAQSDSRSASAEWDVDGACALGRAFVETFGVLDQPQATFVLGRDMRTTGIALSQAFVAGATAAGANVIDIGLASTDQLWFASGSLDLPGVVFTASHNPASYNGIKFCLAGARPITSADLVAMATRAQEIDEPGLAARVEPIGSYRQQDVLDDYAAHLLSLVPLSDARPLKVVADAGNGMAGHTLPSVFGSLNVDLVGLFTELDGSFPNHQPNPLEPENLLDAQAAVREHQADVALVFDGDADRCFIIDERGEVVSPSAVTALIASQELEREPGATIVINTITSQTVAEVVAERGGQLVVSKVGHTFVKAAMAEHNAIFGGEHSAHYYFRDFWRADTGMLAGLHVLALLSRSTQPLSELVEQFNRYVASGEINSTVADAEATMRAVAEAWADRGSVDWIDGLTLRGDGFWFSLRASNTEPLLRLNVEADEAEKMAAVRDEVLGHVRR